MPYISFTKDRLYSCQLLLGIILWKDKGISPLFPFLIAPLQKMQIYFYITIFLLMFITVKPAMLHSRYGAIRLRDDLLF